MVARDPQRRVLGSEMSAISPSLRRGTWRGGRPGLTSSTELGGGPQRNHLLPVEKAIATPASGKSWFPMSRDVFCHQEHGSRPGLVLSTAFGIAQDHGGRLSCTSESGTGTRFTVHLPSAQQQGDSIVLILLEQSCP